MADRSVITAENAREALGVGSVINTKHSGVSKRPAESAAERHLDHQSDTNTGGANKVEDRQVILSEDGNEILTVVNGKIVDRQKRLPLGKR